MSLTKRNLHEELAVVPHTNLRNGGAGGLPRSLAVIGEEIRSLLDDFYRKNARHIRCHQAFTTLRDRIDRLTCEAEE